MIRPQKTILYQLPSTPPPIPHIFPASFPPSSRAAHPEHPKAAPDNPLSPGAHGKLPRSKAPFLSFRLSSASALAPASRDTLFHAVAIVASQFSVKGPASPKLCSPSPHPPPPKSYTAL